MREQTVFDRGEAAKPDTFLAVAVVLFVTHWRWVRRLNGTQRAAA